MDNVVLTKLILSALQTYFLTFTFISVGHSLVIIVNNKINLKKISKYNGLPIKECTFLNNTISIEKIKDKIEQKKLDVLLPFVEKLSNYTSNENLKTIYDNLISLKIKKIPLIGLLVLGGSYSSKDNIIEYSSTSSLGHEFLHLASSYYDFETKVDFSGFCQRKDGFSIGQSLNEGYTELLASRIYNKDNKAHSYKKMVKIVKLLELFFDNPKDMETFYFNHDLLGFVKHMERFASTKEIVNLLLEMDYVYNYAELRPFDFSVLYGNIKLQLKLYKLFISKNKNPEKLQQFTDIICENKIISMILSNKKMKLYKENPYIQSKDLSSEEGSKKTK